ICQFQCETLFAHRDRVAGDEALKTSPGVVNHIQIAIRTKRVTQPNIRAGRLSLSSVGLQEGSEIQKTVEGIAHLQSGQFNIEISLWKTKYVQGVIDSQRHVAIGTEWCRECDALQCSGIVIAPLKGSRVCNAAISR